jgi:hypothetical protein
MKTVKFEAFAKDRIQDKEMNFLKGGVSGADDDILVPPRR